VCCASPVIFSFLTYIFSPLRCYHYCCFGRASPRLKDAEIDKDAYPALYRELILNIRTLFHQCRLVHADLSEYNMLYHDGHLYIIDVSQSVEHDHPAAFDFLRNDITNIEGFFAKMGVHTLGLRRCFDFVTRTKLSGSNNADDNNDASTAAAALERWLQETPDRGAEDAVTLASDVHEDSIFRQTYIPRSLNEYYDPERAAALKLHVTASAAEDDKKTTLSDDADTESQRKQPREAMVVRFETGENVDAANQKMGDGLDAGSHSDTESGGSDEGTEDEPEFHDERPRRGHRHEDRDAKKVSLTPFFFVLSFRSGAGAHQRTLSFSRAYT
jgi:RIO kinase 1